MTIVLGTIIYIVAAVAVGSLLGRWLRGPQRD